MTSARQAQKLHLHAGSSQRLLHQLRMFKGYKLVRVTVNQQEGCIIGGYVVDR